MKDDQKNDKKDDQKDGPKDEGFIIPDTIEYRGHVYDLTDPIGFLGYFWARW